MIKKVLFFCGSRENISPFFTEEMAQLSCALVRSGYEIIFGGSKMGLMKTLAESALAEGGKVTCVIPKIFNQPGMVCENLDEVIEVNDIFQRKCEMIRRADAIIAYPGGIGTLDEVTDTLVQASLGGCNKPIVLYNAMDFWTPLTDFFELLVQQRMVSSSLKSKYKVLKSVDEVLEYLKSYEC